MLRQNSHKSIILLAIAAIMLVAVACVSEEPASTPVPPTSTATPTATPTPTPVPISPIEIDPVADPVAFLSALPAIEASCTVDALGGRDRVLGMLESDLGDEKLTVAEANALNNCLSDETVQAVFIGQLARVAGTLSDATAVCIREQVGGMSAAGLFTEAPAADAIISSLKGVFCLNQEERDAVSSSDTTYGFGDYGGIDALECVVNGVGPTGLEDLMGLVTPDGLDFAALGDLLPLATECGVIDDSQFDELGVTADQVACLLGALGEDGLTLLDPTAAEPDISELGSIFTALTDCGIELDELLGGSLLPIDPDPIGDPTILPTAQVELPGDPADLALPFTEEQILCLAAELGDDEIAKLLEGGAPDLGLFAALSKCEIDLASLLGG